MMNITELKTILTIKGVSHNLTDSDLETLMKYKMNEISSYIGFDLTLQQHTHQERIKYKDTIFLQYYPTRSITEVYCDGERIPSSLFSVNHNDGILYFTNKLSGDVLVKYSSILPSNIVSKVDSLLVDMITYDIKQITTGDVASVTEGGISVSYNTATGLGATIQNKLNDLKTSYSARCMVI